MNVTTANLSMASHQLSKWFVDRFLLAKQAAKTSVTQHTCQPFGNLLLKTIIDCRLNITENISVPVNQNEIGDVYV